LRFGHDHDVHYAPVLDYLTTIEPTNQRAGDRPHERRSIFDWSHRQ
jgi:hypothetical protein